jgi:AGZA family xanthine/uracil permease-like MFS transporter
MGIFNVIGSLQNIESAEAAGDLYPTAPSLTVNGIGSVAAALFGSAFPTTIYIGHPGWKALGARAGYSILNGAFATVICLTGTLAFITYVIPVDAGMAIVLWIGIVITAQAFATTPKEHAPAVVVGLLPGVAGWGAFMAKAGLRAAGFGSAKPFTPDLVPEFHKADQWIDGAFALEQGFIFTSMILAAITVGIIERKFRWAAIWCFVAAAFSLLGIMHSYQWTFGDTTGDLLTPAVPFAIGYAIVGALLVIAPWVTTESKAEGH